MILVLVALIAAFPPTAAIILKWRSDARAISKREDWLERNVGSANGQGNITQMLERSMHWQGRHEAQDRRVAEFLGVPDELLDPAP